MADPRANPATETSRGRSDGPQSGAAAQPKSPAGQTSASQTSGTEASGLPRSGAQASVAQAGAAPSAAAAEPRSFEETRSGQGASAEALTNAVQPLAEGARQLAEQGRQASRQMADSWRQAVDPLMAMQFEISQWFDQMFRQAFGLPHMPGVGPIRPVGVSPASLFGLPPADMKETREAYILAIELPGLGRDDLELRIDGDALVVSGHKTEEVSDGSASYRVSERRYGRFERSFPLPPDVERGRIEAQFKDGVLKVTLPKNPAAAQAAARIEIKG